MAVGGGEHRMYIHANAAVSVDGKLASRRRRQLAISGEADFERVDRLRADMDAVAVGVGTVVADDPSLTVPPAVANGDQPARVVLDSTGRTPSDARILDGSAPTYVVTAEAAPPAERERLQTAGATVITTAGPDRVEVNEAIGRLEAAGIDRLLVEGGGEVLFSLFAAELVDQLTLYVAPAVIGGRDAPTLVDGVGFVDRFPALSLESVERIDTGVLCRYDVVGWRDAPGG